MRYDTVYLANLLLRILLFIHMDKLLTLLTRTLDALFPHSCTGCGTHGTLFCKRCLADVPEAPPVTEHSFIHALFSYRHPSIKCALWRFKYENARSFANIFAPVLYDEILAELSDHTDALSREKYLLIPVPLHMSRLRMRGYNQSALLSQELMNCGDKTMFEYAPDVLVRIKKTAPQARSEKRSARIANLRDAFICCDHAHVRGRIVILIDDVTTTGATLLAAKQALAEAYPRKILAFTVAH